MYLYSSVGALSEQPHRTFCLFAAPSLNPSHGEGTYPSAPRKNKFPRRTFKQLTNTFGSGASGPRKGTFRGRMTIRDPSGPKKGLFRGRMTIRDPSGPKKGFSGARLGYPREAKRAPGRARRLAGDNPMLTSGRIGFCARRYPRTAAGATFYWGAAPNPAAPACYQQQLAHTASAIACRR